MVDIARDPRWGRIVEGAGEDPYLGIGDGARARPRLPGRRRTAQPDRVMACVKHSSPTARPRAAATTTRPTSPSASLREIYLPPFKAAVDAGAGT